MTKIVPTVVPDRSETGASPDFSVGDAIRRVERALRVCTATVDALVEQDPGIDLAAMEAPAHKVVAESAMLLRVVASLPADLAPDVAVAVQELGARLAIHARTPRVKIGFVLHPALARDYAAAHTALSAAGWPDREVDALLESSTAGWTAVRERMPHRELEQAWLASLHGGERPPAAIIERTAIGTGVDLLFGSRDDVYALTQALMYVTDFGSREASLGRGTEEVLAEFRSALAGALDDDDFDLAGELLLAWPWLGVTWDPVASFAFRVLARVEDEVGILPSLTLDADGYRAQEPGTRSQYVTASTYHPAYVMGLPCAATLRAGRMPSGPAAGDPSQRPLVAALDREMAKDRRSRQWHHDYEVLTLDDRCPLAPFLLDVILRRAARRLDFAGLHRLLSVAFSCGEARSPAALQAARLLSRAAKLAVAVEARADD